MLNESIKSKVYEYYRFNYDMKPSSNGWLSGDCPTCGAEHKFGVNIHSDKTNCFKCGENKSPLRLIGIIESLPTNRQVYEFLKAFEGVNFLPANDVVKKYSSNLSLPAEYRMVGLSSSVSNKVVEAKLRARGYNITTLMRLGIGYCISGKYGGRIIMPYYQQGKLVYFTARTFLDRGTKFSNPTEEETGVGKSLLIYNIDALFIYKKIWLFESITNALTIGNNATATGGKSLSTWQKSAFLRSPIQSIVIGLDEDAYKDGLKLAMEFSQYKRVKLLKFPKEKDANDLGRKATRELEKATPYKTYQEFYKEYINYR